MPSKGTQHLPDVSEAVTVVQEPKVELVVHRVAKFLIQKVTALKDISLQKKRSRRLDEAHPVKEHDETTELDFPSSFKESPALVDPIIVTVENINVWMRSYRSGYDLKTSVSVGVIGIQPANNLTSRKLKAFIQRIALAAVGLRNPLQMLPSGLGRVPLEDFHGIICRPTINYDVFNRRIGLRLNTQETIFNELPLVIGWRYDRNCMHAYPSCSHLSEIICAT
jgi:hypothetical protein